jgi:hypothetical protein
MKGTVVMKSAWKVLLRQKCMEGSVVMRSVWKVPRSGEEFPVGFVLVRCLEGTVVLRSVRKVVYR